MVDSKAIVIVIDDDRSVREALDSLLRSVGLEVHTYASTNAFKEASLPDAPACIILDVRMPGQGGLELQRELLARDMKVPIIFVTAHADVPMAVRAMKDGAVDFLPKPFRDQELLDAIQAAIARSRTERTRAATIEEIRRRQETLTPREREVMAEVVLGRLNKQIADHLGLSEITVKAHRAQVMRKMQANSVAELVRMADACAVEAPIVEGHKEKGPSAAR